MKWCYFTVDDEATGIHDFRYGKVCSRWWGMPAFQFQMFDNCSYRWVDMFSHLDFIVGVKYCHAIDFKKLYKAFCMHK